MPTDEQEKKTSLNFIEAKVVEDLAEGKNGGRLPRRCAAKRASRRAPRRPASAFG